MENTPYAPQGRCPYCGYPIDPGRCPECGVVVASCDLVARGGALWPRRAARRLGRLAGVIRRVWPATFVIAAVAVWGVVMGRTVRLAHYGTQHVELWSLCAPSDDRFYGATEDVLQEYLCERGFARVAAPRWPSRQCRAGSPRPQVMAQTSYYGELTPHAGVCVTLEDARSSDGRRWTTVRSIYESDGFLARPPAVRHAGMTLLTDVDLALRWHVRRLPWSRSRKEAMKDFRLWSSDKLEIYDEWGR